MGLSSSVLRPAPAVQAGPRSQVERQRPTYPRDRRLSFLSVPPPAPRPTAPPEAPPQSTSFPPPSASETPRDRAVVSLPIARPVRRSAVSVSRIAAARPRSAPNRQCPHPWQDRPASRPAAEDTPANL